MSRHLVGERRFRADRGEVARAREFVRGIVPPDEQVVDDLVLVTSELATNAVLHARSTFVVRVFQARRSVQVWVHDSEPVPPIRRRGPHRDPSGRGMEIVASIARRWGVVPDDDGKWVWAELRRPR